MYSPKGSFFLLSSGPPVTKMWFTNHIRDILQVLGLPQDNYAGHSFRIGHGSYGWNCWLLPRKVAASCPEIVLSANTPHGQMAVVDSKPSVSPFKMYWENARSGWWLLRGGRHPGEGRWSSHVRTRFLCYEFWRGSGYMESNKKSSLEMAKFQSITHSTQNVYLGTQLTKR